MTVKESAVTAGVVKNKASVKVGGDAEYETEEVENPVPEAPHKTETNPGEDVAVKPGDEITYEISYKNYKSNSATVKITDVLDANVDYKSASDGGSNNSGTVTWEIANVAAGAEGTVTLVVTVKESAVTAGVVKNKASVG